MRLIKAALIFWKVNFKKSISVIITLSSFILILNLILGIVLQITGVMSKNVINNDTLKFMEIRSNQKDERKASSDIKEIYNLLKENDKINGCFLDLSFPIHDSSNVKGTGSYYLIGVPKAMLSDFGIKENIETDDYLFLPDDKKKDVKDGKIVYQEASVSVDENGIDEVTYHDTERLVTGWFKDNKLNFLPEPLAIVSEDTAKKFYTSNTTDSKMEDVTKLIATVKDVTYFKDIEEEINSKYSSIVIRYDLKNTGILPEYAKVITMVSAVLIAILAFFCITNLRSSIGQILNERFREIGLLSVIGVGNKKIIKIEMFDFMLNGVIAYMVSIITTIFVFAFLKAQFMFDLLTGIAGVYVVVDFVIAMILFSSISAISLNGIVKKINKRKVYREVLR